MSGISHNIFLFIACMYLGIQRTNNGVKKLFIATKAAFSH